MIKQSDSFYNRFSLLYPIIDVFLKPQKRKLFEEINSQPFGQVLEIGVGNGTHLHLYKTHNIIGIDTSSKMLDIAIRQKHDAIQLLQMSGEALVFKDQTFDYVILSHTISVVNDPEKLLEETYRVLKPNGKIFILNHFTPNNWLKHIDNVFHFISKLFHFKSRFYIEDINAIQKYKYLREISFSKLSYFKLLIYAKK